MRGTITAVPLNGGHARVWSSAPELAATEFLGANGIKLRHGAIWATNLDQGTLLRIPIERGRPGRVRVEATGLAGIDDIAFAGSGDEEVIAALNGPNKVVLLDADGHAKTLLTTAAGLQNPTSVAVRGRTVYVLSAAYTTATDPNLVLAAAQRGPHHPDRHRHRQRQEPPGRRTVAPAATGRGRTALEVERRAESYAVKQWGPFSRY